MRRYSFSVVVVGMVATAVALAGCQQAPPVESGQAQELLDTWMGQGNKVIAAALEFVAAVNFRYVRGEQGRPYNSDEFKPENFEGKDDLVRLLQASYQEGAELIEPFNDADMLEAVKNPYQDYTNSRTAYWMEAVEHTAEHYGNFVVYYRLNGIVPPASRPQSP
jgi:hypothetical protein